MAGDLLPHNPEEAKALAEAAKIAASILGESTGFQDVIGYLGFDKIRVTRLERMAMYVDEANRRLSEKGVRERIAPSLNLELPLLTAAADENSEELGELWTRLLMAALDPSRAKVVRKSFIEILKKMDPLDALVFQRVDGHTNYHPNSRDAWASTLERSPDEIEVSLENLGRLGCVVDRPGFAQMSVILLTPTGRLLKRALAD